MIRLENVKGLWTNELSSKLWAYRTRGPIGETPFSQTFGTEVMIPAKVEVPTQRVRRFEQGANDEYLKRSLDKLEEKREVALIRMAAFMQRTTSYFNKKKSITRNSRWGAWSYERSLLQPEPQVKGS